MTIAAVEWVIVRNRVVRSIIVVADEIIPSGDLATAPETSAKRSTGVVDTCVDYTDLYAFTLVASCLYTVRLDLVIGGKARARGRLGDGF